MWFKNQDYMMIKLNVIVFLDLINIINLKLVDGFNVYNYI